MSTHIHVVADDSFEQEVLEASLPVLVDFWAEWCGPCKALTPLLEGIAPKYEGKVKFLKLNVDDNPVTPPKFAVRGIPTLILFKDGQVQATRVGLLNTAELTQFIDDHL